MAGGFKRPHAVDITGLPIDPKLRDLELRLSDLAVEWRGSGDQPAQREQIVKEYDATLTELYARGWDNILTMDAELPDELMPDEYNRRHPPTDWPVGFYIGNPPKRIEAPPKKES